MAFIKETTYGENTFFKSIHEKYRNLFLYYGMIISEEYVNTLMFDVEVHHIFLVQEFQASTEFPGQSPYCTLP